ncbi:MAG: replicative DNA helicase [Clostridiaceae bacterium]|jgi:replicative DNA helicase|nr:replicative DNA helicase [Clostridiaceae bacterium]
MDAGFNRIPPHHVEAEQSILGSILIDRQALSDVSGRLKPEAFYLEKHRELYEVILELYEDSQPVDIITVSDALAKRGTLEKVGDVDYIAHLANSVPTTANVLHYVSIVEDKALLRNLIDVSGKITDLSYQGSMEGTDVLATAEKSIFDLSQGLSRTGLEPLNTLLDTTFSKLEELCRRKGELTGVPSGFIDLDRKTTGFQKSDLILIAARPSIGKTSFALNIAANAALRQYTVAIFSLEMSQQQLVNRLLSSESTVELEKMRSGRLEADDWKKIGYTIGPLSKAPIYIDDNASISVTEMLSKLRRLKLERGLDLVVIDYLQLMEGRRKAENRQQEISEISRGLKIMAKELDVPVIALSQLSRAPELRTDHRPILSDLRESGAIEQDADMVLFLYRDDYYHEDSEKKNIVEVIIAKHRNGSTGTVELAWLPQFTKFGNYMPGGGTYQKAPGAGKAHAR